MPLAADPKVVEPPAATEPLQEKRTRGAWLRVIDAASCDQETHTTRASRTAVLTAHHHMAGENRLGETFWKTTRNCVKYRKKVSERSSRRTGGASG